MQSEKEKKEKEEKERQDAFEKSLEDAIVKGTKNAEPPKVVENLYLNAKEEEGVMTPDQASEALDNLDAPSSNPAAAPVSIPEDFPAAPPTPPTLDDLAPPLPPSFLEQQKSTKGADSRYLRRLERMQGEGRYHR